MVTEKAMRRMNRTDIRKDRAADKTHKRPCKHLSVLPKITQADPDRTADRQHHDQSKVVSNAQRR